MGAIDKINLFLWTVLSYLLKQLEDLDKNVVFM